MPGLGEWLVIAVLALFLLDGGKWHKTFAYLLKMVGKLRGSAHRLALEVERLLDEK